MTNHKGLKHVEYILLEMSSETGETWLALGFSQAQSTVKGFNTL